MLRPANMLGFAISIRRKSQGKTAHRDRAHSFATAGAAPGTARRAPTKEASAAEEISISKWALAMGLSMPGAKAQDQSQSFSRSAEALLPPHECGGSHRNAGTPAENASAPPKCRDSHGKRECSHRKSGDSKMRGILLQRHRNAGTPAENASAHTEMRGAHAVCGRQGNVGFGRRAKPAM